MTRPSSAGIESSASSTRRPNVSSSTSTTPPSCARQVSCDLWRMERGVITPLRSRRRVVATAVAVTAALAGPAGAAGGDSSSAPRPPVGRSQLVPTVPLGQLALHRTADVGTTPRPTDADLSGWDAGIDPPAMEGSTVVQAGELVYEGYLLGAAGPARPGEVQFSDEFRRGAAVLKTTPVFTPSQPLQPAAGA